MECPYCGKEMTAGFVQSNSQMYFNRGNRARFFAMGDLKSRNLTRLTVRAPYIKGYMCEKCQMIILDMKRKQHEKGIYQL